MRQIVSIFLLFICVTTSAQELSVKEFREVTNDLSARTRSRQDNNGNDCALVKVQLAASGATFTGNVMGNVAFSNNEYWVYLTEGTKRLKVTHPSYLPLEVSFADYGINVLSGNSTYVLTILLGNKQDICQIMVDEANGIVKVTGKMTVDDWAELKGILNSLKISSVDLKNVECEYIPSEAFYDCKNLTSITIPNSVTTIGSEAFYDCKNLTSITIPNSVTTIGSKAFYDCKNLTSITIPNSITTIGDGVFSYCNNLTSITIPNSVTTIGDYAFECCDNLILTIPNSVKSIGNGAVRGCKKFYLP